MTLGSIGSPGHPGRYTMRSQRTSTSTRRNMELIQKETALTPEPSTDTNSKPHSLVTAQHQLQVSHSQQAPTTQGMQLSSADTTQAQSHTHHEVASHAAGHMRRQQPGARRSVPMDDQHRHQTPASPGPVHSNHTTPAATPAGSQTAPWEAITTSSGMSPFGWL